MACLDAIDCGADRAKSELVFLHGLLIKSVGDPQSPPEASCSLDYADVYRSPTRKADDFICFEKALEVMLEGITTLRVIASEGIEHLIEVASHSQSPSSEGSL